MKVREPPKRRRCTNGVPVAIPVMRRNRECVVAGRNVRVVGNPSCSGIDPLLVEGIEPVTKVNPFRREEAHGRVIDLDVACPRRKACALSGSGRALIHHNRLDENRRHQGVGSDSGRVDHDRSPRRGEPEAAVRSAPCTGLGTAHAPVPFQSLAFAEQ